ncbi:hypothetical protein JTB14_034787 [Gonioctena quinquepunctata]|nr:hypothetical protein JTB14_034787 [Gonioctena quinquepunctata]
MDQIERVLQKAINNLTREALHLGFKFSSSKAKCVHFCRLGSPHRDPQLRMYGGELESRPSKLKVLDSIQETALRLALGAFRTSPYESLCVEAGVPPLKFRREQLSVSYCYGILAQPHHPCYPPIPSDEEYDIYERRATITRPAGIRLRELLNSFNYDIPRIHNWTPCEIPPWTLNIPEMELQPTEFQDEKRVSRKSHNINRIKNRGRGGSCFYMLGKKPFLKLI